MTKAEKRLQQASASLRVAIRYTKQAQALVRLAMKEQKEQQKAARVGGQSKSDGCPTAMEGLR
jgi:hypothetical protein